MSDLFLFLHASNISTNNMPQENVPMAYVILTYLVFFHPAGLNTGHKILKHNLCTDTYRLKFIT
jgi:hypothetical protein